MFCPRCRAEYREEYTVCADCGVALVPAPPEIASADPGDFVTVFASSNPGEIALVESLLAEAGILHIAQGETAGAMLLGVTEVSFLVPESRRREALALLSPLL